MSITTDQIAQMTQREFARVGERLDGVEQRLERVEHRLDTLEVTVKNGFSDIASRLDEFGDNLSKTLMLWDRRFTDHQITVDTKLRAFEKSLARK